MSENLTRLCQMTADASVDLTKAAIRFGAPSPNRLILGQSVIWHAVCMILKQEDVPGRRPIDVRIRNSFPACRSSDARRQADMAHDAQGWPE
jgi:hypothetical protein